MSTRAIISLCKEKGLVLLFAMHVDGDVLRPPDLLEHVDRIRPRNFYDGRTEEAYGRGQSKRKRERGGGLRYLRTFSRGDDCIGYRVRNNRTLASESLLGSERTYSPRD